MLWKKRKRKEKQIESSTLRTFRETKDLGKIIEGITIQTQLKRELREKSSEGKKM
jgi:hypothetical protein